MSGILRIPDTVPTTTVKISKEASRKLEALQARIRLRSGKRSTKQAIIEDLIERAMEDPAPLILIRPSHAFAPESSSNDP